MTTYDQEAWFRVHRVNCYYGCPECQHLRLHVTAAEARRILNPGATNQTRVPVPGPVTTPPAGEPRAVRYCDHGRKIGIDFCARCSL